MCSYVFSAMWCGAVVLWRFGGCAPVSTRGAWPAGPAHIILALSDLEPRVGGPTHGACACARTGESVHPATCTRLMLLELTYSTCESVGSLQHGGGVTCRFGRGLMTSYSLCVIPLLHVPFTLFHAVV